MSRLFEALGGEQAMGGALKLTPRKVALRDAVSPDTIAAEGGAQKTAPEVEASHSSPAIVPGLVALSDAVSQGVTGPVATPPVPTQKIETENWSSQARRLNFGSVEDTPANATVDSIPPGPTHMAKPLAEVSAKQLNTSEAHSVQVTVSSESRLVALSDPDSLGAEKFRALVTRLDHLRTQREMKSFQVTSSVVSEGKTMVAANVAVTLAKYSGSNTLLIEGDLHRPAIAALLGLSELDGVSQWWSGKEQELGQVLYRVNQMPLWFLPAGKPCDRPSDILRSMRFVKAVTQLASEFDWIVVDSTPMLPTVDVNLWSKLVDGTLLVVREGLAPLRALEKGLQALDHPRLIGVVMNVASGPDQANYEDQYGSRGQQAGMGVTDKRN